VLVVVMRAWEAQPPSGHVHVPVIVAGHRRHDDRVRSVEREVAAVEADPSGTAGFHAASVDLRKTVGLQCRD